LALLDYDTSSRGFIKISSNDNGSFTEQILYDTNPELNFQAIHFANGNLGFAVGRLYNKGVIWRNGNGITQTLSIQGMDYSEFQIYPNPATTEININFKKPIEGNINCSLTDLSGKIVYSEKFSKNQNIRIKTSNLPKGNYILFIKINKKTYNQKIIIN